MHQVNFSVILERYWLYAILGRTEELVYLHPCIKGLIPSGNPGWEGLLWRLSLVLTSLQLVEREGKRSWTIPWRILRGQAGFGNISHQCSTSQNGSVLSLAAREPRKQSSCVSSTKRRQDLVNSEQSLKCFIYSHSLLCSAFLSITYIWCQMFVSPIR